MPYKSEQQRKWMFWAEKHGKVKKGIAKLWAKETPNLNNLPKYKKKERGK